MLLAAVAWASAAAVHTWLPDPPRAADAWVRPAPSVWRAAALGRDSAAATLVWLRAVQHFTQADPPDPTWLHAAVTTCTELDPHWRTPATFGALMLGALGDVAAHDDVLRDAVARWPDDAWFSTALGMSRYLHGDDPADAARWFRFAAETPGADPLLRELADAVARGAP